MSKRTTTMLLFFRLEPDGSETCFRVEFKGVLNEHQAETVRRSLVGYFKYLPTHEVLAVSNLIGNVIEVGPRLAIETPFSSSAVEIMHHGGDTDVLRVEAFRRHLLNGQMNPGNLYDPVTEQIHEPPPSTYTIEVDIQAVQVVPILEGGIELLREFSAENNLGFKEPQFHHIMKIFSQTGKNPTDVALFQLAQMWSDHCRHLVYNARLLVDGVELPYTLFKLLKEPYEVIKGGGTDNVLVGFFDNASVIRGYIVPVLVESEPGHPSMFVRQEVTLHHILSGETHNYPTHVSPYPGRATEIGGEIRDQLGAGRGSDILYAGQGTIIGRLEFLSGYRISGDLLASRILKYPPDKASPFKILVDGTAGWHDYANCFGRPCTYGFFYSGAVWRPRRSPNGKISYERVESLKPVAFGVSGGTIRQEHLGKGVPQAGMKIFQIGGPAFPIGFMGGSGSSNISGSNEMVFDLNAVQRGNPEMERRVYQVLLACLAMGVKSPIVAIHDQGAGGIANVLTELVEKSGGRLYIGSVRRGDPTMPDVKVWVCEYQERMGLVIRADYLEDFEAICRRENCPCEILGEATGDGQLVVYSEKDAAEVEARQAEPVIELDLAQVLEEMPPIELSDETQEDVRLPLELPEGLTIEKALRMVLRRSEVGSKDGIIRTVDSSIGGQVILNQRCGPFGTPVNDCSLVALSRDSIEGQASSIGVAPFVTVLDSPAGARMAIGEMITNLMGVLTERFEHIQCICNAMWPANINPKDGELVRLVRSYEAIKQTLLELDIAIIGGKDSSSLATKVDGELVKSIETLVFTSVAPVPDVRRFITPEIKIPGKSELILIDIASGKRRLGGSSLGQCFGQLGNECPDLDDRTLLKRAFGAGQSLLAEGAVLAGHDISDGGLLATVSEMCFAGGCGAMLEVKSKATVHEECFAQELGYVVECRSSHADQLMRDLADLKVPHCRIGATTMQHKLCLNFNNNPVLDCLVNDLRREWERTSYEIRKSRVNPDWARRERVNTRKLHKPPNILSFIPVATPSAVMESATKHKVAVIREQGSNGHEELVGAFHASGFEVVCIHMSDFLNAKVDSLEDFRIAAFPGGFANGDTLGAAVGWANKIGRNPKLQKLFSDFFAREDTLSLGICNGAQLGLRCGWAPLPKLRENQRPLFTENESRSFCHQWVSLKVTDNSPSIMLKGMAGSILGAFVANREGRFNCDHMPEILEQVITNNLAPLVYVDSRGQRTTAPPYSPSGSFIAGVCDPSGRHLYMMPHAFDRGYQLRQWENLPLEWEGLGASPWLQLGHNAREWCDQS